MFPGGQQPDMARLLEQAAQMQQDLMRAQVELAAARVGGWPGGGRVTATADGTGDLVGRTIAPEAADPNATETLADLVVAAVRDATCRAQRRAAERLGTLTQGLGGDLGGPAGGLSLPGS